LPAQVAQSVISFSQTKAAAGQPYTTERERNGVAAILCAAASDGGGVPVAMPDPTGSIHQPLDFLFNQVLPSRCRMSALGQERKNSG
jgi:hypothetical protein